MTEKHLKETLTYLAIREMEIKTTLRFLSYSSQNSQEQHEGDSSK